MKKVIIILGLVIAVGIVLWKVGMVDKAVEENTNTNTNTNAVLSEVGDPIEVTLVFYESWLNALTDTKSDPYAEGLAKDELLTDDVQAYLENSRTKTDANRVDPVLCLSDLPKKLRSKQVSLSKEQAQVIVLGRGLGKKSPEQAQVTLSVIDGAWKISSIDCLYGESTPEREFSFEREGFLLKSVPPPLDSKYWHLVFEENDRDGHTVPLFFDGESLCDLGDGKETACDESKFQQTTKASIQGQMTEAGVNVKHLKLMN